MSPRPLSDRRHDLPARPHPHEVRVWTEEQGWHTIALSAEHDDGVAVARALIAGGDPRFSYAEVWGPDEEEEPTRGHRTVTARLPETSRDERHEMWLRAADEHYTTGYTDSKP